MALQAILLSSSTSETVATDGITVSQMVIGCLTFLVVIALFVAAVIIIIELGKKAIKNLKLIKQKRKK